MPEPKKRCGKAVAVPFLLRCARCARATDAPAGAITCSGEKSKCDSMVRMLQTRIRSPIINQ